MSREGQAKVLSSEELKRVYAIAKDSRMELRNVCLLDFSFKLGLRVKEMTALMISDLVDEKGDIRQEFHLKNEQSKGSNGGRCIYLTNTRLRKHLKQYLDSRAKDLNRHLFKSQKTEFSANSLQQLFKRFYRGAGIKGAKSHSGRRTFATTLIEKGFDIKSVSILMGHSNIQTTAKYINENPVRLGEMVKNM